MPFIANADPGAGSSEIPLALTQLAVFVALPLDHQSSPGGPAVTLSQNVPCGKAKVVKGTSEYRHWPSPLHGAVMGRMLRPLP